MKTKQKEELKTINLENIPAYLKEYAPWCDWRKEKKRVEKIQNHQDSIQAQDRKSRICG